MKCFAVLFLLASPVFSVPVKITIDPTPAHTVPRTLNGIFFEDINYGADGGLYAELVQNRSFEHQEHLHAWAQSDAGGEGTLTVSSEKPFHADNLHFLRLQVSKAGTGVANEGWDGIVLDAGANYRFSTLARHNGGSGEVVIRLVGDNGETLAESRIQGIGREWKRLEAILTSSGKADRARLVVLAASPGDTDLDVVSLFPEKTFKRRDNGLRADLATALMDMKPGFLRFPGGCIVEGQNMANAYRWKETVGNIATRRQNKNRWMDSFSVKAPQYYQTYGLGFYEYFLLCEDLGAEPLPILNCGMSCQFEKGGRVPLDQLKPFIQDGLDLIEFANGPVTSTWGAKRAAMGHPAPFNLKLLGIGNEQWGPEYLERYKPTYEAFKAKHPEIQLVMASGPKVGDGKWRFIMDAIKAGMPADIVDEHFYCPPDWFLANADMYDAYDRKGPKIFAGEFAAHADRKSSLQVAIAEAAMMTGILRNSDVVVMASYAPLFAKKERTQWAPDLIYFDNRRVCLTPSYYVQALFGQNRPDAILPVKLADNETHADPAAAKGAHKRLYVVAGTDRNAGETVLFVVNAGSQPEEATIALGEGSIAPGTGKRVTLTAENPNAINTLDVPDAVRPQTETFPVGGGSIDTSFPANSLTVLRFK